jgi:hypothetical protein
MSWNLVGIVGFNWVCPIYLAIKSKKNSRLKLILGVICWVLLCSVTYGLMSFMCMMTIM